MVVKQEVKSSQMQGPMGLTMVKFLGHHKILEVFVVGPDLYRMGCFFQKMSLLFCGKDSEFRGESGLRV